MQRSCFSVGPPALAVLTAYEILFCKKYGPIVFFRLSFVTSSSTDRTASYSIVCLSVEVQDGDVVADDKSGELAEWV